MGPRFKVEISESTGGDLYEIEYRTYFDVVDTETGATVLHYRGADCGMLATEGPAVWTNFGYEGVRSVTISEDDAFALVEQADHTIARVRLPGRRKRPGEPSGGA